MEFLVNDLSLDAQFSCADDFMAVIGKLMELRRIATQYGRELFCHKNLLQSKATVDMTMFQMVQSLPVDERRSLLQWLTKQGPFWDERRYHAPDDWLECDGCIVTDTAVGEAGWCCLNGIDRRLAGFSPSNWEFTPVRVELVSDENTRKHVDVENYWDAAVFRNFLEKAPLPLESWEKLRESAVARFTGLFFAENAFDFLKGHPFSPSAAQRILFILDVLNRIKGCFDEHGERTAEGHKIYRDFFTGKKGNGGRGALFADSSEQEKNDFKSALTFGHPENPEDALFCPWHGKIQTPQLRVHFSWPVRFGEHLYIVYVGPKITKR